MKRPHGKKGAFGSEEIRFAIHTEQNVDVPGPGEYNPLDALK